MLAILLYSCNPNHNNHSKSIESVYNPLNDTLLFAPGRWTLEGVYGAFFSPDNQWISAGCGNGQMKIYNRHTLQEHCNIRFHKGPAHSTLFSADSRWMISSSYDSSVAIFNVADCAMGRVNHQLNKGTYTAIFNNRGNQYAACGGDSAATVFDLKTDSVLFNFKHSNAVHFVWYSDNDQYLATACEDGLARVFDVQNGGALVAELKGHIGPVYCVVIDQQNEWVVTVGNDKTVRLWDLKTSRLLNTMRGHTDVTFVALFSPDKKLIGSCSADHTIRLWETTTGKPIGVLRGHTGILSSLHFSPDGTTLLSGSMDGTIRLWDVATQNNTHTVRVADLP